MKVEGSNIDTLNSSGLTRDMQLSHRGVKIELITTKQGIAIVTGLDTRIIKNGETLVAMSNQTMLKDFEHEVINNG